jgi:hypothetical protein
MTMTDRAELGTRCSTISEVKLQVLGIKGSAVPFPALGWPCWLKGRRESGRSSQQCCVRIQGSGVEGFRVLGL